MLIFDVQFQRKKIYHSSVDMNGHNITTKDDRPISMGLTEKDTEDSCLSPHFISLVEAHFTGIHLVAKIILIIIFLLSTMVIFFQVWCRHEHEIMRIEAWKQLMDDDILPNCSFWWNPRNIWCFLNLSDTENCSDYYPPNCVDCSLFYQAWSGSCNLNIWIMIIYKIKKCNIFRYDPRVYLCQFWAMNFFSSMECYYCKIMLVCISYVSIQLRVDTSRMFINVAILIYSMQKKHNL